MRTSRTTISAMTTVAMVVVVDAICFSELNHGIPPVLFEPFFFGQYAVIAISNILGALLFPFGLLSKTCYKNDAFVSITPRFGTDGLNMSFVYRLLCYHEFTNSRPWFSSSSLKLGNATNAAFGVDARNPDRLNGNYGNHFHHYARNGPSCVLSVYHTIFLIDKLATIYT